MEIAKVFQITAGVWMVPCRIQSEKCEFIPISQPFPSNRTLESQKLRNVWNQDEDKALQQLIQSRGSRNWSSIAKELNIEIHKSYPIRSGKQCRERWINHLNPELQKHQWTDEEDQTIKILQQSLGNKWSEISKALIGRTENQVKNRWKSLKKIEANSLRKKRNDQKNIGKTLSIETPDRNSLLSPNIMPFEGSPYSLEDIENLEINSYEPIRQDYEFSDTNFRRDLDEMKMLSLISDLDLNFKSGFDLAQNLNNSKLDLDYLYSDNQNFKGLGQYDGLHSELFADSFCLNWCLEAENQKFNSLNSHQEEKESLEGMIKNDSLYTDIEPRSLNIC
jgi:hypothetical protein